MGGWGLAQHRFPHLSAGRGKTADYFENSWFFMRGGACDRRVTHFKAVAQIPLTRVAPNLLTPSARCSGPVSGLSVRSSLNCLIDHLTASLVSLASFLSSRHALVWFGKGMHSDYVTPELICSIFKT